ncbi:peptidase S28 [Serendipita vermifera]|nr:peptidase S28 [Serendipita vermifera]
MLKAAHISTIILLFVSNFASINALSFRNAQSVNFQRLLEQKTAKNQLLTGQTVLQHGSNLEEFPPQTFPQLLDHDNPRTSPLFEQRYWVNARHFKPGGPVIVIDGGETSGEDRLPFLDTGIADILAKATKGLGVVLEHRYYGESVPVKNFTTDSLRWLNNSQSLADSAYFMTHVNFSASLFPSSVTQANIDNLRAPHTPWIYYGGSYAGARAAHMRVLYPDIVFGAISSSGVTHATINNWEYMDIIRTAAPSACSEAIQSSMTNVDALLIRPPSKWALKALFGLQGISHDDDFVSTIVWPLSAFQGKNWDPAVGTTGFEEFCVALTGQENMQEGEEDSMIREWSRLLPDLPVDITLLRFARHIRRTVVPLCPDTAAQDDCFGTHDDSKFQGTALTDIWRLWTFQVCTEWGYFIASPPDPEWPSMISRLIDVDYEAKICRQAFPPGEHMQVPAWPNVTIVNALGDFAISYPRLAFIDGEIDPWRPCTPHSQYALPRNDTISRPFKLIKDGVHHHDQNGLKNHTEEPEHIRVIHQQEIEFVKAWLKEWKKE